MAGSRVLIALLGSAVLLVLASLAARWGVADARTREPIEQLSNWSAKASIASLEQWLDARNALISASSLDSGNPQYQEWLGVAHANRVQVTQGGEVFYERALDHFRVAAAQRPTSPFTWANVAQTKYRSGQTDAEFAAALENAARLGPWEPRVQLVIADLGLALWDEMAPGTREQVATVVRNGMKRQGADMVRIAQKRGRLGAICGLVNRDERVRLKCP